jgi:hypothetical protein
MPGQNLLARIDLFAEPEVVLTDSKYWTPGFARLFIESWDDVSYRDPHAGKILAEVAVKLVAHLDKESQEVLGPCARAILGSSYRAIGELAEASFHLESVLAEYRAKLLPRLDEASCYRRMAYVRRDQLRYEEAINFAKLNISLCEAEQAKHETGRGYAALGAVYLYMLNRGEVVSKNEPLKSLSQALEYIDPRKSMCSYETAIGNLAFALGLRQPWNTDLALRHLRNAQRLQAANRISRKTLPGSQLRWMIALVYQKAGVTGRAVELLKRARQPIYENGYLCHYIRISLDLCDAYYRLGRWGSLRAIAEEILSYQSAMSPEALSALKAWHKAVREQNSDPNIWVRVLEKVRWGPPQALAQVRPGQVERPTPRQHSDDQLW